MPEVQEKPSSMPAKILSPQEMKQLAVMTPKASPAGFEKYLRAQERNIAMIAPSGFSPERLMRSVMSVVMRTPDLMECSIQSLCNATIMASELGLTPSAATGECAIVAYNKNVGTRENPVWRKEAQLMPMYRGLIGLAHRSGLVKSVRARAVYQGDHFVYKDGIQMVLEHEPDLNGAREDKYLTHFWCVISLKDGGIVSDVMTKADVDAIRARSKSGKNGPWVTDYAEMGRKTVCRRCLKYAPMSVEMAKGLAADDAVELGGNTFLNAEFAMLEDEDTPPPATKTSKVRDRIAAPPDEAEETGQSADEPPAPATTQPPAGKITLTQSEISTYSKRLAGIPDAPSILEFKKQCETDGLTQEGMDARLSEMEAKLL